MPLPSPCTTTLCLSSCRSQFNTASPHSPILSDAIQSLPTPWLRGASPFFGAPSICLYFCLCTTVTLARKSLSLDSESLGVSPPGLECFHHSTCIECLLCAWHCSKYKDTAVNRVSKVFILIEVTFYWGWGERPPTSK